MKATKKEMNPIPPTLRGKKRYVKFRLVCIGASIARHGPAQQGQSHAASPRREGMRTEVRQASAKHCPSLPTGERVVREQDAKFSLYSSFARLFGEQGIAEQRLWLIKWFPERNEGIVRCALEKEEQVKAGLLFLREVHGEPVVPLIEGVSGSLKKLKLR
ncbi:MAG: Rpp14/Pop5 family protein [archaeon]